MELKDRTEIASRNAKEIVTKEDLNELLRKGPSFNFYYGTAPTGPVHIGYMVPLGKVADLIKSGGDAKILIADYHAYLDDRKSPWEEISIRSDYYQKCIELILGEFKDKVEFVRGSSFQTSPEYVSDLFRISGETTATRAQRAASEVCRMREPKVSELMYPLLQTLDVKYLESDLVVGGMDQRHIYMLSRAILPTIKWEKPVCIFTPLITSLKGPGEKMSASIKGTYIKVHESENELRKLVSSAHCPPKEIESNPILDVVRYIILPIKSMLKVERDAKFGGDVAYEDYESLENDFNEGRLHPADLKNGVSSALLEMTKPIRDYFEKHTSLKEDINKTYAQDLF